MAIDLEDRMSDKLAFALKRGWPTYASIVALTAVVVAVFLWRDIWLNSKGPTAQARIVSLAPIPVGEEGAPGTVEIVAVTADGVYGRYAATGQSIDGCRVGDRIAGTMIGSSFRIEPKPCR